MEKNAELNFPLLQGRIVVVSGAGGGGIGTAVTRLVASSGATVVAADCDARKLDKHIGPLVSQGLSIEPVVADVRTEEGIAAVMERARGAKGQLHGLVTVVGGGHSRSWGSSTRVCRENWHALLSFNLDSMFFMTQAVAAELKAQRRSGSLVAISAIHGLTATPFNVGYGAAKAAVQSVVQTLGLELARDGIRVNAVAPGMTSTPAEKTSCDPQQQHRGIPMARYGRPEEIAGPVLFLLSDLSSYMTGQCLIVDGGCNLKWCHLAEDNLPICQEPAVREAIMKR